MPTNYVLLLKIHLIVQQRFILSPCGIKILFECPTKRSILLHLLKHILCILVQHVGLIFQLLVSLYSKTYICVFLEIDEVDREGHCYHVHICAHMYPEPNTPDMAYVH